MNRLLQINTHIYTFLHNGRANFTAITCIYAVNDRDTIEYPCMSLFEQLSEYILSLNY